MTCVVAIIDDKKNIYMGADSQGTCISTQRKNKLKNNKVFLKDNFLFGVSGSIRMLNLLHHVFVPPEHEHGISTEDYMCSVFVKKIIECFNEGQFTRKNEDAIYGGTFLVGYKGIIFLIDSDFQVTIHDESYIAIGSGAEISLGYLFSHNHFDENNSREILMNSLYASEKFNITVSRPFVLYQLDYIEV